jgi:SAM-dependent methyltransferase
MSTSLIELTRPLPPYSLKALKYNVARFLLNTVGRLSRGIEIGWTYGFDSGVMLDHVYENKAQGRGPLGRLIDRIYLDAPGWVGIRNRGALLHATIIDQATRIARRKGNVELVDVACGGGRYVLGAVAALRDDGVNVSARLRDYRQENVDKARANAAALGLQMLIERGDAFSDRDLASLGQADIAIVSGLHEIIDDDALVRRHFDQLHAVLRPSGRLIVTVQPDHPQVEFIARVLTSHSGRPWAMRLRCVDLIRTWAQEAGFTVETVAMEPRGIFGVLVARKN